MDELGPRKTWGRQDNFCNRYTTFFPRVLDKEEIKRVSRGVSLIWRCCFPVLFHNFDRFYFSNLLRFDPFVVLRHFSYCCVWWIVFPLRRGWAASALCALFLLGEKKKTYGV